MKNILTLIVFSMLTSIGATAQTLVSITPSSGTLCVGDTAVLNDTTGGTWSSSNPAIATITATGGLYSTTATIRGISAGVVTITFTLGSSYMTGTYTVTSTAAPITGGSGTICPGPGLSVTLTDITMGGTWASSNPSIATVGAGSGILTAVTTGSVTITYSTGSCSTTAIYTVGTPTSPISGAASVCMGATTTLTDGVSGGTWSSGSPTVATVGTATGILTGIASGSVNIYYTVSGSCPAVHTMSVDPLPSAGFIVGPTTVCAGGTMTLIDSVTVPGMLGTGTGTWSSSAPSIATVGSSSGIVTGVSGGTVIITFTASSSCGSPDTTASITVSTSTGSCTISGPSSVAVGASITLTGSVSGGTWSSSSTSIAAVGSSSGVITGAGVGTATITYSYPGCGGTGTATAPLSVVSLDGISGHVNFATPYYGIVRVYLIQYNPITLMLSATDSANYYCYGTNVYYQFTGLVTDSFRVKAWTNDTGSYSTGYVPTYHPSSFYWYGASAINHTAGSSDINEDISMISGVSTGGLGFVGGSVLAGANKHTYGSSPVVGMRMYIVNSATGQLQAMTRTDALGNYTFSGLTIGQTYYVFPDSLNYITTPYTGITLTSSSSSMSLANFAQHTLSKSITPVFVNVPEKVPFVSSVVASPNPANGSLHIIWNETAAEDASIMVTDIAGRMMLAKTVLLNAGAGMTTLDISRFPNGMYIVTIKSATLDYTGRVTIQH